MKTKTAVVYEPGRRIEIEELDLDGPREGEVLIRYTHAGLCHSDIHIAPGALPARLPVTTGPSRSPRTAASAVTAPPAASRSATWARRSSRATCPATAGRS